MGLTLVRCRLFYFGGRWKLYRVDEKYRKATKILISIVVGALLLAGLYLLFKDTLLPCQRQ